MVISDLVLDANQYRCFIGTLLYLAITRPNITYPVQALIQFIQDPYVPYLNLDSS